MMKNLFKVSALILGLGLAQGAMAGVVVSVDGSKITGNSTNNPVTLGDSDAISIFDSIHTTASQTYDAYFQVDASFDATANLTVTGGSNNISFDVFQNGVKLTKTYDNVEKQYSISGFTTGKTYALETSGKLTSGSYTATLTISAVPEAEEWAMMMLGLGMIGFVANRKKASNTNPFGLVAA